ncbi:MAG TPA: Holliday junction branch migration protein RuvA [Longimicrobiaceae bacterium]|nr:Holliday junction branch migration protein RuvA [Longimicrobiaceae bacterium]
MISRIRGELLVRDLERVEVMTPGGVAYELLIPTTVYERLPRLGEEVTLRVFHLIREDSQSLFGFLDGTERTVFQRLLLANGVGPKLALGILSSLSAEQLVRAIRERNVATLTAVSGVGKKTAERLVVDLQGKLDDVAFSPTGIGSRVPGMEEALRALTTLGLSVPEADRAVRAVIQEQGALPAAELIRQALARMK